jgi:biotin carboxylase
MTRVLLLSHTTGYQLRAFNDAAERLGIELVFATDRCHKLDDPWQDRAIPVRFHDRDPSVDAIVERARRYPVAGVIAVGDRPVVLAAHAAAALDLPWHSVEGALASTDKRRARAALAAAGLPSPGFRIMDAGSGMSDAGLGMRDERFGGGFGAFPCVLKPLGLSGSRGVIRANDSREFGAAFERIRALLLRPQVRAARTGLEDEILVEDYIDGREYALEGVLTKGALQVFAIFDKPDPLDGPFFEETIYVTPSHLSAEVEAAVADHVRRASHALGLTHGPIHAECRIARDRTVYVLEVAARPIGGLCSRVLTFVGAAASLEEVLLLHALGQPIADVARESSGAAVMMIPIPSRGIYKGVEGEADARAVPGVTDIRITAKTGQLLETLPEAGSYLGFIFAKGETPHTAEAAVRNAHARLRFTVSKAFTVHS